MLLSAVYLTACASPSGPVPLVITSHTPVKATATQLREGVAQMVKDWSDAKARIEDIHTRRVAEMMAIEADIAFLEEAAGGGRQSARETAVRVAAGAVARKWLAERHGITIRGHLAQLGCEQGGVDRTGTC